MRSQIVVYLLSIFTMFKTQTIQYWNPFEQVMNHFKNETIRLQNFIDDQTIKVKQFTEDQKIKIENTLYSSYHGAKKTKDSLHSYFEEKHRFLSDEITNFVEGVKESREIVTEKIVKKESVNSKLVYPEMVLSVPSIIVKNGYVCETHTVLSQGYILSVHRIPSGKNSRYVPSKTVLLQHGIFASSADWILNGPTKGLAYVLADAGYDVWMTNIRGNKYSREHIYLKTDTKEFWNFSWHEVAQFDVPEIIDYITKIKGNAKITYIGHSMGTSILFAMLTLRPEYNTRLAAAFALAPVVFMENIKSPLKNLAPIASNVAYMEMLYGSHEFVPKNSALGKLYSSCDFNNNQGDICRNVVFYLCGENKKQFNKTLLPVFISNLGTGTSWKTAVHFAQEVMSKGRFQQFDYGNKNVQKYGSKEPPEYDLSKITLPITLIWTKNDLLSDEKDVMKLYHKLPSSTTELYEVPCKEFNHLDYLWAVDADTLINNKILSSLRSVYSTLFPSFHLFSNYKI